MRLWLPILIIVLIGAAMLVVAAAMYHRRYRIEQPLGRFLLRYFVTDYLAWPVRCCPGVLGMGLRSVYYRVAMRRMGRRTTILAGCHLNYAERIEIGADTSIGLECIIDGAGGVIIGDWVRMGPRVTLITANHRFEKRSMRIKEQGLAHAAVEIGDDVWFGANVTVLPGVKIGTGAVVAAGAVVTRDIPEYAVVVGVPGRVVKYRED